MESLAHLVPKTKKRLLQMHFESGVGHIGGNLSCLDALMVLHHQVLKKEDAFILAKGHAAGALYATLWSRGILKDGDLESFHKDATKLSGHPAPGWLDEITFATGSLGHGFSLAAGMALGKKIRKEPGRVFCMTSDGEWQEGSNWEALIFAVHHRLTALTLMVDANGLQGFGTTREISSLEPLASKLKAFGMATEEVDGHDWESLRKIFGKAVDGPRAVLLRTRKGNGVSFMENRMEWHYLPMTEAQYRQALEETDRS